MIPTSESGWSYDGPLSTLTEWHALILGIGAGLVSFLTGNPLFMAAVVGMALGVWALPFGKLREVRREPWYAVGGALLGRAVKIVPIILQWPP